MAINRYITTNPGVSEKMSRYARTFIHDTMTDEIFIPYSTIDILCAANDGVRVVSNDDGAFVPLSWVFAEYPEKVEKFKYAEKNMRLTMAMCAG